MREIDTDAVIGPDLPLSKAIVHGDTVYVSGQTPRDPDRGGEPVEGDIREQTAQVLENASAILDAAGSSLDDVVKSTVFVTDMGNFAAVNEVYGDYMSEPYPARSAIEVADLAADFEVEIEFIAAL